MKSRNPRESFRSKFESDPSGQANETGVNDWERRRALAE